MKCPYGMSCYNRHENPENDQTPRVRRTRRAPPNREIELLAEFDDLIRMGIALGLFSVDQFDSNEL